MGLDAVELILAVEDTFQVEITDQEASTIIRVGDLQRLVLSKLEGPRSLRCLSSAAFYRARRAITHSLGIERREIRPSTPLAGLLPRKGRRRKWRAIQNQMDLKLPRLMHSRRVVLSFLGVGTGAALLPVLFGAVSWKQLPELFLLGLCLFVGLMICLPQLALDFPNRSVTVGDLARDVVALNHGRLVEQIRGWNENEVWQALCRLIVIQTGVDASKITPESTISGDLALD